jgi:hypothetical protein
MPLEQVGVALPFAAQYIANKVGKTGLTVTVDVQRLENDGTVTTLVTGAAATEWWRGIYYYILPDNLNTVEGFYIAIFQTADTLVDQKDIATDWLVQKAGLENLNATVSSRAAAADYTAARAAKLDNLDVAVSSVGFDAAGEVSYLGPVAPSGDVTIVRGDSYLAADGRALEWATAQEGTWPDLTGASIKVTFGATTFTGSVVVGTGATKRVRLELTAVQTSSLVRGRYDYDVEATLSGGNVVTLTQGEAVVLPGVTP